MYTVLVVCLLAPPVLTAIVALFEEVAGVRLFLTNENHLGLLLVRTLTHVLYYL